MADDIFKLRRASARGSGGPNDGSPDNGSARRENTEAEIWGFAVSPTSDANYSGDSLLDVSQVVRLQDDRKAADTRNQDREAPACQEEGARRYAALHGQRPLR